MRCPANLTGPIDTRVNISVGEIPFYNTTFAVNQTCGYLAQNEACSFNITITAT